MPYAIRDPWQPDLYLTRFGDGQEGWSVSDRPVSFATEAEARAVTTRLWDSLFVRAGLPSRVEVVPYPEAKAHAL